MADSNFFDGSTMPPKFNHAANGEPVVENEPREFDEPHLKYNPPVLVPGGQAPVVNEVAREELDGPARDAIEQAQDRMDRGRTEADGQILTQDFNQAGWSSKEIQGVEQEDRDRGLELEPEWDEQAQYEYDRWALETLAAEHDDKWGEQEDVEQAEDYQLRMDMPREPNVEHDNGDHEH